MKLLTYFRYFLEDEVNLNQSRIDTLDARVATITSFLMADPRLGPAVLDVIRQGSYAQRTIIKPLPGDDFDADILLQLVEQPDWEPRDYTAALYQVFRGSSTYKEMVSRHTRCVKVQYSDGFHIDVVPYLERGAGFYITNRHENVFELTNPEGFNEWLDRQNRSAGGHLVETIRLLKYVRDFKNTFSIASVILTPLLGGRVNELNLWTDEKYYGDMPTALYNIVCDLDDYLRPYTVMPVIADPSCPSETFNHRWDQAKYANFRNKINYYAGKVTEAYEETDKDKSVALWQEIFGPKFEKPPVKAVALSETKALATDTEMYLDRDFGISTTTGPYKLRVSGRVDKKPGFRDYALSRRGNSVMKGRYITFKVTHCDVPAPYDIYWKVKNTGEEARRANQLRGEIRPDQGRRSLNEYTAYRGSHYVECYVVKNGQCVVSDRQRVLVE